LGKVSVFYNNSRIRSTPAHRSVHNIRIERLWVDVTQGIGHNWYEFFDELERFGGLDINNDAHIWLLHFLFLEPINWDLTKWAEMWNSHRMSLRGMRNQTPSELFYFGMVQQGVRGARLEEHDTPAIALEEYGVDWADIHNASINGHHRRRNPELGREDAAAFTETTRPQQYSRVDIPETGSPMSHSQAQQLAAVVQRHGDLRNASMSVRRVAWHTALQFCREFAS
jgi:hypothetical protein